MKITEAMSLFIEGEGGDFHARFADQLAAQWQFHSPERMAGTFQLLWSAMAPSWSGSCDTLVSRLIGEHGSFNGCHLEQWRLVAPSMSRDDSLGRQFLDATLIECDLSQASLRGSRFSSCWIDNTTFAQSDMSDVTFTRGSGLIDVDVTDANLTGANFSDVDRGLSIIVSGNRYTGNDALGYLARKGAIVGELPAIYRVKSDDRYPIVHKIAKELLQAGPSQYLGLTQRGASAKNIPAAEQFVRTLMRAGFAQMKRAGAAPQVEITPEGRPPLLQLVEETGLEAAIEAYFD